MSKKDTTLNLRIDAQLKQRFMDKLKANHETATDVLTKAMEDYCNDNSNDTLNQYSNDVVTTDEENSDIVKVSDSLSDKLNELWDVINLQQRQIQKLEYRLGKKCDQHQLDDLQSNLLASAEEKIDQQQLDERLAMASMPIWAELEATPSETPLERTETRLKDDSPSTPPSLADGLNQLAQEIKKEYERLPETQQTNIKLGELIGNKLIENGFKSNEYKVDSNKLSVWGSKPPTPRNKHYFAYLIWSEIQN